MRDIKVPSQEMVDLLMRAGSNDPREAADGFWQLAKALETPLRKGVLQGDILDRIYEPKKYAPGQHVEWPLDLLSPGSEKLHVAYTMPSFGRIPDRHVAGDYIAVPTYEVTSSIDYNAKYAREANWDIQRRALQVLEGSFVRKANIDGWRTILYSAYNRGVGVYDDQAAAGLFTKRLVALTELSMRRNGGGNSTSLNRGKLTDMYISPESKKDMYSWDLSQVDDVTRRQIFTTDEMGLSKIGPVTIHELDELGVDQDFQRYWTGVLGGTIGGSKSELGIGLDLAHDDSFLMPWKELPVIHEDPAYHRSRRISFYAFAEWGFSVLDSRRVIAFYV